jgi:hypothetical protein
MDPGVSAASVRPRREARILLACIRGGGTCTLGSASDAAAGSTDRASPRQGGQQGAGGRLPGAGCHGRVAGGTGMQDGPEWSDERLDSERLKGVELTASSVRSCLAPTVSRSSRLAFGSPFG